MQEMLVCEDQKGQRYKVAVTHAFNQVIGIWPQRTAVHLKVETQNKLVLNYT